MKGRGPISNISNSTRHKNTINNNKEEEREIDSRLHYVLTVLDIAELYNIFISHNISFVDMLLLDKDDMNELQLDLYHRNRIWNFSVLYKKYAVNYSIEEMSDFFSFNRQFIFLKTNIDDSNENNNNEHYNNNNNDNNDNDNDNDDEEQVSLSRDDIESRIKLLSQSSELTQHNPIKPKHIFSQRHMDKERQLPKKKITLSTSKENVHDEVIEERKVIETSPNTHQLSISEEYKTNKALTEGNHSHYQTSTISTIGNKKNQMNNNIIQDKAAMLSYNAYQNYSNIKQDADNLLIRLSKLKEESKVKKNKYKTLLQKIDKNNNNIKLPVKQKIDNMNLHFKKMMYRIDQASQMKMTFKAYEQLNQIKEFIDIKGKQIKLSDIQLVNRELDVLFNSLLRNDEAHLSNKTNEKNAYETDDIVNEVEEVEEEYEVDEGK